ncbi:MAG: DUF2167 domain-containing protein [Pseudomonadota bacterium]
MKRLLLVLTVLVMACLGMSAIAQDNPAAKLPWKMGPTIVQLGSHASLKIPDGYAFLDPSGTRALNIINQNPSSDAEEYTLADKTGEWIAYFAYEDTGYVKDDDKIDPDDILASVRKGTEHSNQERRSRGWAELNLIGWSSKPEYDSQLKSLAWSFLFESESSHEKVVNYNTRLLGRHGVMDVVVVAAPEKLSSAIDDFKSKVPGFQFAPGETYGEYQPGDHVAAYGLAALITGGAAAVAAKKGLFTVIGGFLLAAWKFVLAGLVALSAWFKSLFKKKK